MAREHATQGAENTFVDGTTERKMVTRKSERESWRGGRTAVVDFGPTRRVAFYRRLTIRVYVYVGSLCKM
jgi:hypothetical protein